MSKHLSASPARPSRGERIAGALSYVVGPLLLLLVPRLSSKVRFHVVQATLIALVVAIINLGVSVAVALAFRHSWYLGVRVEPYVSYLYMAEILLWLVLVYFGYQLSCLQVPTVGPVAKRLVGKSKNHQLGGLHCD